MAFSESIKDQAYKRSGGQCECTRSHSGPSGSHHEGRCTAKFARNGSWDAHHIIDVVNGGDDSLLNCEVLCIPCQLKVKMRR